MITVSTKNAVSVLIPASSLQSYVVANQPFTGFKEARIFQTTAFPVLPILTNWKYESVIGSNKWDYIANTAEATFTGLLAKWQEATKFQSTSEMFSDEYY